MFYVLNVPQCHQLMMQGSRYSYRSGARACENCRMDRHKRKCYKAESALNFLERMAITAARIKELKNTKNMPSRDVQTRHSDQSPRAWPNTPDVPTSSSKEIPIAKLEPLSQFGFFLNIHNFQEAIMGRSGQRPAAVLIDVVYLWAIYLSGSERSPSQPHQDSAGLSRRSRWDTRADYQRGHPCRMPWMSAND
ncbi:hypothetical protein DFH08DRAFT_799143 [Mycena albidolilacea]|uniref:Uncharacterized protein n=1 Tax=Mycena albidolilacea TaxID=1033008 RepID=A0AAD7APY7_9AGAR|nr:hypothetical protein DFH08DRAFT_799143 [Mycena albidolilacea]